MTVNLLFWDAGRMATLVPDGQDSHSETMNVGSWLVVSLQSEAQRFVPLESGQSDPWVLFHLTIEMMLTAVMMWECGNKSEAERRLE